MKTLDKPSESWVAVSREEDGNRLGDKPEAEEQGERDVERGLLGMVLDREKHSIRQPDGTCDDKQKKELLLPQPKVSSDMVHKSKWRWYIKVS